MSENVYPPFNHKRPERFPVISLAEPVSILMPVCNEADVIEFVVEEWVRDVFRYLPEGSEFLFDEAASTDGTKEILERLALKYKYIKFETRASKDGFANAAKRLYRKASCPLIFFTDSDGQYVAKDFWKIAKFIDNFDLVRGVKIGRKDPIFRRLASAIFNKITQFLFNMTYMDFNSAFFLIRAETLKTMIDNLNCMRVLINTELLLRVILENYTIKEVYVLHRERMFGTSRGLKASRFIWDAINSLIGLYAIKSSYRLKK